MDLVWICMDFTIPINLAWILLFPIMDIINLSWILLVPIMDKYGFTIPNGFYYSQ